MATVWARAAWCVSEKEVREAAADLVTLEMDRRDLVRIGPVRGGAKYEHVGGTLLGWRRRITWELTGGIERTAPGGMARPCHLAGIDWRQILVEKTRDHTARTWWLPRAVVKLLDAAEHTETQLLHSTRPQQTRAAEPELPSRREPPHTADGHQAKSPDLSDVTLRPYTRELQGHLYSVLSRKPGIARKVAGWKCAVCSTARAAVLDHCHEHGYVRAPVCHSCNTLERPDHLYSNDIRVANRYARLFDTHVADWLRHWHRCPGCRARTTLPLPHLAAWTAHIACRPLRPTHPAPHGPRGRKPCGTLRVSWTGSHNAPHSCQLTITVDLCPSGEHRVLAQIAYREAAAQFSAWLTETAPAVAAAAGPDRLDGIPARTRPVIPDTTAESQSLF
ncbi:endonuclease domain-containing protein [Streptomyces sp. NPDC086010]|uniref:endonuclease domain-containing protein n=1 Tax=Streptomyces sp. NPDC086010 TaxID=3365745 RepID=UPI0037D4B96F